eukprot:10330552-Alexandrium_andersonii.AAC.1
MQSAAPATRSSGLPPHHSCPGRRLEGDLGGPAPPELLHEPHLQRAHHPGALRLHGRTWGRGVGRGQ